MLSSDQTIDHGTLRRLVDAGATIGAEVVGGAGGWGVVLHYGRASKTLAVTRGQQPRTFRQFETLARYLQELGLTELRVHTAEFTAAAAPKPSDKRRELASARMKRAHEAAAYDQWFRAQVQASIDDPRPSVPDADVRAAFAAKRDALRARIAGAGEASAATTPAGPRATARPAATRASKGPSKAASMPPQPAAKRAPSRKAP